MSSIRAGSSSGKTFAEMFRHCATSFPVQSGDMLRGSVVGSAAGASKKSRFKMVDFGLKTEVPFAHSEIAAGMRVGDTLSMPLVHIEDEFHEPLLDYQGRSRMPSLNRDRNMLLASMIRRDDLPVPKMVTGRITRANKGGFHVKIFGTEMFLPRGHSIGLASPSIGQRGIFSVLDLKSSVEPRSSDPVPALNFNGVVSYYTSAILILSNLLSYPDAWEASGGGSDKERSEYLKYLTRMVFAKNPAVRSNYRAKEPFVRGKSATSRGGHRGRFYQEVEEAVFRRTPRSFRDSARVGRTVLQHPP